MFAFVSPLGIGQINRAKAQEELHQAIRIFQMLSTQAYAKGTRIKLELNNERVIARFLTEVKVWRFEKLNFPKQLMNFNRNGYLDQSIVFYDLAGEAKELNIMNKIMVKPDAYTYAP